MYHGNQILCRNLPNVTCLNHLKNISSRTAATVLVEKNLEAPIVVAGTDHVDIIGPPDPVSNLRPIIRKARINETALQRKLRQMQDETQKWNQYFWEKHNTKFIKERQEYKDLFAIKNMEHRSPTADEMSEFYKKFLDENWESHVKYNFEWYKKNFTLLLLALSVSVENILYKF